MYLYNPARKPGQCHKFHKLWTGPFKVTAKLSDLNYETVSLKHRKQIVHINLLKTAGYVMHQQFNIQQLYALPTLHLCVLYLSENKQQPVTVVS